MWSLEEFRVFGKKLRISIIILFIIIIGISFPLAARTVLGLDHLGPRVFLCSVCMFFPCSSGFSLAAQSSSHSPETCIWGCVDSTLERIFSASEV